MMAEDTNFERIERLLVAVGLFAKYGSAKRVRKAIRTIGWDEIRSEVIDTVDRDEVNDLYESGVDVIAEGLTDFPTEVAQQSDGPLLLFTWGNQTLLRTKSVAMCGSRHVSARGLNAAAECGIEVAESGLTIVSGYASGVDTETHLAALRSAGRTVIVLAEGINGFKRKRVFHDVPFDIDHVLALSQFAPHQAWNVGAAMTRNGTIVGLGRALVVIEAGSSGGTLNAGIRALEAGRPVLALQFNSQETPPGNEILIRNGAIPILTKQHLGRVIRAIGNSQGNAPVVSEQLRFI